VEFLLLFVLDSNVTVVCLWCRKKEFVRDALAARSLLMPAVPSRSVACFLSVHFFMSS